MYELARIVAVVDPFSYVKLRRTLPNIIAQVESSDIVLINKVDCCSLESLDSVRAAVLEDNPAAELRECRYGVCDFELFQVCSDKDLTGEYAKCRDPNYASQTLSIDVPDMRGLEAILVKGDGVYRAKGSVYIGGRRMGVQFSSSGLVSAPELDNAPGLVVIGRGPAGA
jgi:G3E family GTPase